MSTRSVQVRVILIAYVRSEASPSYLASKECEGLWESPVVLLLQFLSHAPGLKFDINISCGRSLDGHE